MQCDFSSTSSSLTSVCLETSSCREGKLVFKSDQKRLKYSVLQVGRGAQQAAGVGKEDRRCGDLGSERTQGGSGHQEKEG